MITRGKERQEILAALVEPMRLKDIAAIVGKSVKTVFVLLERMARAGDVIKPSRGLYARAR